MNKSFDTWMKGLLLVLCCQTAAAVYRNPGGTGQVLLVPFYSVNNGLNSLVEVVNTTADGKAIKINIKERWFGQSVISYNVYLGPHDSWSFALIPDQTGVPGVDGDQGLMHLTVDDSCAPELPRPGMIASPEFIREPYFLERVREGFIEVLEMGTLTGETLQTVSPQAGQPVPDCELIGAMWATGGQWAEDPVHDLMPASGGLNADVSLINVAEGINYGFPAVALADFFPGNEINHTAPNGSPVTLDAGMNEAWLPHDSGFKRLRFETGVDAVNATLMSPEIEASYAIQPFVNGLTEVVLNLPTKELLRISSTNPSLGYQPPFNAGFDPTIRPGSQCRYYYTRSGFEWGGNTYNHSGVYPVVHNGGFPRPPRSHRLNCYGGLTFGFVLPGGESGREGPLTGTSMYEVMFAESRFDDPSESGYLLLSPQNTLPLVGTEVSTGEQWRVWGMPIVGVVLQRYTNAGAGPGLLAQYGGARLVKSQQFIERIP